MRSFKTFHPVGFEDVITKITIITDNCPAHEFNSSSFFADGLPGIYFQESNNDIILNKSEKKLSNLFLYGQTVKPIEINTVGPSKAIIVQLHPPAVKTLFGMDAYELTDTCIDYSLLNCPDAPDLKNRLLDTRRTQDQINLLIQSIRRILEVYPSVASDEMHYAVKSMFQSGGAIALTTLRKELNVTERTFQRKFLQHVGTTPRLYKRICKFQAARLSLERNSFNKLTDVAYDHDFSDQSHFNRIFREFTGYTPREYLIHFTNADLNFSGKLDSHEETTSIVNFHSS